MCRAIGYGEIIPKSESEYGWNSNREKLSDILDAKINRTRYVTLKLQERDDVFDALRKFFNVDNVSGKSESKRQKLKQKKS